jgi:exonuclease III
MWLLDQWAERHILDAQKNGEFDNLPGSGKPLTLEDNSQVPPELRASFTLLKNAGCLPPELESRQEAIALTDLLRHIQKDHPDYSSIAGRLSVLELKLHQAGMSVEFLHSEYATQLMTRMMEK